MKPVRVRPLADADIDTASAYLRTHDPPSRLLGAVRELARHPGAGPPRYAHVLPAEGLRMWPVAGSAYLIFYLERADHIDIVRVLHGARDIPVLLRDVT